MTFSIGAMGLEDWTNEKSFIQARIINIKHEKYDSVFKQWKKKIKVSLISYLQPNQIQVARSSI